MDSNIRQGRTAKAGRRAVPVIAIAVLAVSLVACQTTPQGPVAPVQVHVVAPQEKAGDGITQRQKDAVQAEKLARQAREELSKSTGGGTNQVWRPRPHGAMRAV